MKKKIISLVIVFFAMVFSCAAVFADTVVFDKKNKGNEKDFVESEFNSIKELEALCKKYPKNNAEVLVKFDDDLTVEYVTEMNNKINEIHKCFKTELDLMSFGTSTFNKKGNVYVFKFTYESGKYSPKYSLIESNVVAFFDFKMSSNYFDDDNLKKALKTQQQYEFNTLTELEKFFKTHKEKSFSLTIPANSKIQSTKDFENLSKFLYNNSLYKNSMEQKKFLDAVLAILRPPVVIDSYILVDGHKTYRTVFIDKEENSYVVAAQKEIWENERKENEKAGLGKLTNDEVEKERRKNEADGHGRLTNAEILSAERKANEKAGLGKLTNSEVEKERKTNEAAGLGKLTNKEVNAERVKNEKAGLGKVTNAEAEKERKANEAAGNGRITNAELAKKLDDERLANEKVGLGKLTNAEVEKERKANETAGRGRFTNAEILEKERKQNEAAGLVFVEGGTFQRQSEYGEPVKTVTVSSFYLCDHEVTQREYRDVTGKNPSFFKGDNRPVEHVSWEEAIEYCNALSRKHGLTPCYTINGDLTACNLNANGYRLPTDAEWDYAARGGNMSHGYRYSGSDSINSVAWYMDNSNGTHNVKTKSPNELGLYDMSGNVWEWVWDYTIWFSDCHYSRGGCCNRAAYSCEIPDLGDGHEGFDDDLIGFRVVRSSSEAIAFAKYVFSDLTLVEGGTFEMGSTSGEYSEKPIHSVTVSSFYMCDHEVTQKEYYEIMKSNPSYYKGDDRPVESVSWYDAIEYCNALSLREGLTPCYYTQDKETWIFDGYPDGHCIHTLTWICKFNADGYRLPTEAEWEFAARGGNKSSGYVYSGSNSLEDVAWHNGNSESQTHDVKTKSPNELGLYDMSGNVWEWCWDWYGNYSSSLQTNPSGVASGTARVLRGGSSRDYDNNGFRVAYRDSTTPSATYRNLGFRVVRSSLK